MTTASRTTKYRCDRSIEWGSLTLPFGLRRRRVEIGSERCSPLRKSRSRGDCRDGRGYGSGTGGPMA